MRWRKIVLEIGAIALSPALSGCWFALGLDEKTFSCDPADEIPISDVASPYCIDKTEVSIERYARWLAGSPDPAKQRSECSWNDTLVPGEVSDLWDEANPGSNWECASYSFDQEKANHPELPVACVDWCDAATFCETQGKRLCGAMGGGALDKNTFGDFAKSEWSHACSGPEQLTFPYGDTFDLQTCGQTSLQRVGARRECEGGYPGLSDMSGNVREWIDACEKTEGGFPGATDNCQRMGGYWDADYEPLFECASVWDVQIRMSAGFYVGFRCCRDIEP
jgi:formylglycine-generating enzyme